MSRHTELPKIYTNQKLMDDLNEFLIAFKVHNHLKAKEDSNVLEAMKRRHPLPSVMEVDRLQSRINEVLKKDVVYCGRDSNFDL